MGRFPWTLARDAQKYYATLRRSMTTSEPKISVWFDHGVVQYLLSEHDLTVHLPRFVVFVVYPAQDSTERARCDNWQKRAARSPLAGTSSPKKKSSLGGSIPGSDHGE